jgi:hypothetical protein
MKLNRGTGGTGSGLFVAFFVYLFGIIEYFVVKEWGVRVFCGWEVPYCHRETTRW